MRMRLAIAPTVALLVGLLEPACLALCAVEAQPMAAHAFPPCHAEAASPALPHPEPEPAEGGCSDECAGCSDEVPLLSASAPDPSGAASGLLVRPASHEPTRVPGGRGRVLRRAGQDPPPPDLLLVTTSWRL